MILGLAAVVLMVVGTVAARCRPELASCPTYVAYRADPVWAAPHLSA